MQYGKRTLKKIRKHIKTRKSPNDLETNHIAATSPYCRFMHKMIDFDLDHNDRTIVYFNHITALVTCLETFFRDLFILIVENNHQIRKEILNDNKYEDETVDYLEAIELIIDKNCRLQDFSGVSSSFKKMLKIDFVEFAQSIISPCAYKGAFHDKLSILNIHSDWIMILSRLYEERHNVIHDANYVKYKNIDMDFLFKAESVAIILPQFLLLGVVNKFVRNRGIVVMSDGKRSAPAIWGIEETISMNWKIKE